MKISFVIPCYRSEKTIEHVVNEINSVMSERPKNAYEIILVNDCSPDNVYSIISKLAKENSQIKVINFARNFGKASAVLAGFRVGSGDIIVNLDDDGQCPLNYTGELIDALGEKYDISMAAYTVKSESLYKRIGSRANAYLMSLLLDQPPNVKTSNFWAVKKFVAKEMTRYTNPFPNLQGLLFQISHNIVLIPIEERKRFDDNVSGFTLLKSAKLVLDGCINFSIKPLRVASFLGFLISGFGFVYGIVLILKKIMNTNILIGYSSLMVTVLFIGGVIMILLGIIGEYLGRLLVSINNSPQSIVRDTINIAQKEDDDTILAKK